MKTVLLVILGFVVVLAALVFGWEARDYTLVCSKCLARGYEKEQRLFGLVLHKKTVDCRGGDNYVRIYVHPCKHVPHRGGMGRRSLVVGIACGESREGALYRPRDEAVAAVFAAEERIHDVALAKQTFLLVDRLSPPDQVPSNPDDSAEAKLLTTLYLLAIYLDKAKSAGDWQLIVQAAEDGFNHTNGLPELKQASP